MSHDPRWLREAARTLSSLLQTREEELDEFIRERLDGREGLEVGHLVDVRNLLVLLCAAIEEPSAERWKGVEHARRTLESWEEGMKRAAQEASGNRDAAEAPPAPSSVTPQPSPAPLPAPPVGSPRPLPRAPAAPPAPLASPWAPGAPAPVEAAPQIVPLPRPASSPPDPLASTVAQQGRGDSRTLPFKAIDPKMPPRISLEPHPELGQTAPTSKKPNREPLPFASAPAPSSARPAPNPASPDSAATPACALTLEQYAYFCAEKGLWPDHGDHIRRRYGLDPEGELAADRHYHTAFASEPALRQRFDHLVVEARRQWGG